MTYLLLLPPIAYLTWLSIKQQQRIMRHQKAIELLCEALKMLQHNDLEILHAIKESLQTSETRWDA